MTREETIALIRDHVRADALIAPDAAFKPATSDPVVLNRADQLLSGREPAIGPAFDLLAERRLFIEPVMMSTTARRRIAEAMSWRSFDARVLPVPAAWASSARSGA